MVAVAGATLSGLLIWGFIEGRGAATLRAEREEPIKAPVEVSHDNAGGAVVTLGPDLQKQVGIRVMPPPAVLDRRQAQAYGEVIDLQPFTDLSNTMANAKAQLAIAAAKLAASQAAFERAQALHKDGHISTAQLEAAEATYQADAAAARAAQVQTQDAAASANQAWGPVLGRSLTDGGALARELVEHKKVLVQVTLPLGVWIAQAPRMASIETTNGERVAIEFVSPATRTDPKIQGVSFFYTASGASDALPGMNVIAFLPVGPPVPAVAVPASAVVWLQGRAWVYVRTTATTFTRREIPTTQPQSGGGYVVPVLINPVVQSDAKMTDADDPPPGLAATEPLVVDGAQMLLSQEFSAQIRVEGD
jgi:hypothetical protein